MDFSCDSPVFDSLLETIPWARELWAERRALIADERWNINALNSAGNEATDAWLKRFLKVRAEATLDLLQDKGSAYAQSFQTLKDVVHPLFSIEDFAQAEIGSPKPPWKGLTRAINRATVLRGYSIGQFKADVLLLAQPSLRGMSINQPLNISGKRFPLGLDLVAATFQHELTAQGTQFGPFTEFSEAKFQTVAFINCQTYGPVSFTFAAFHQDTLFQDCKFEGSVAFHAASFQGPLGFLRCTFDNGLECCGTVFHCSPDFSGSVFHGKSTFEASTFHKSAHFAGTSFPGTVYIGGLPQDIQEKITAADHP